MPVRPITVSKKTTYRSILEQRAQENRVDFVNELAGRAVDIGGIHIDAARRWAVQLDTGTLVFVNTDQLLAE